MNNIRNRGDFLAYLMSISDEKYCKFATKITESKYPRIGVRVPKCREIAKEILRGFSEEPLRDFLGWKTKYFEEVMIKGFVIAGLPYLEMRKWIFDFVGLIDNWEICDTFCASLKSVKKNLSDFLEIIDELLEKDEFYTRVALVCLMDYYLTPEYLNGTFERVLRVKNREEYYVKMAVAWALATSFAKFPEETMAFFKSAKLPEWTHNKTIAKARESYRVSGEVKEELRRLRQ